VPHIINMAHLFTLKVKTWFQRSPPLSHVWWLLWSMESLLESELTYCSYSIHLHVRLCTSRSQR